MIPAAIALTAIRDIEDYIDNNNGTVMFEGPTYKFSSFNDNYHDVEFDANGSRAAAGWMVFICCFGIIFHFVVMSIRICYPLTGMKYMIFYSCMVSLNIYVIMYTYMDMEIIVAPNLTKRPVDDICVSVLRIY